MSRALRARSVAVALVLAGELAFAGAAADSLLTVTPTHEPRAFGYQVGDVVSRTVAVHVPDGLVLDESSVPRPGVIGPAMELRRVTRGPGWPGRGSATATGPATSSTESTPR